MNLLRFLRENLRWIGGGFLLMFFSSFGQTYFISLFGGEIRTEFDLSHGEFGGVYMVATLASAATLPFVGKIVDVLPISKVAMSCLVTLSVMCLMMAFSPASILVLVVVLYGLRLFGQGMMIHISQTAMGRWYVATRGRAVSFSNLGIQMAEATLPICFVALAAWIGWRQSWVVGAGLLMLITPIIFLLMKKERVPLGAEAASGEIGRQWTRAEVLRDPYFWIMNVATLVPPFVGTAIFFHQIYITKLKGWPHELFVASFFMMSFSTFGFGLIFGILIDRFTAVRFLPSFLIPLAIACILIAEIESSSAIFAFMMMFGVSYGSSSSLFGTIWPEVYGTRHLGSIRSVSTALMVFSSAAGPGITGWMIDAGIDFNTQLYGMSVYCVVLAAVMFIVSVKLKARQERTLIEFEEIHASEASHP